MPWKMYLIEPVPFFRRSLRRFWKTRPGPQPPANHYHDKSVVIDAQVPWDGPEDHHGRMMEPPWPFDVDQRSPAKCDCGYVFQAEDHRQLCEERLYKGSLDGKLYVLREHPPGATWVCDWFPPEPPNGEWTGPDGKVWAVMLPSGVEWLIYSYASGLPKRKWTVTGMPPLIDVSPSIAQQGGPNCYHGFIGRPHTPAPGIITEDCEGRKFPQWPSTA
jgi:hypothetical protein